MTFDEAQQLQISGAYSGLLRASVVEQVRASEAGRREDEIRWTLWIVKACRYIGRTVEGLAHAEHAVQQAEALGRKDLIAEAVYAQALMLKVARRGDEAMGGLVRALEMLPPDAPDIDRAIFELERAELALECGRLKEARDALARGGAQVHWLGDSRLLSWVLYLRALLEDDWTSDMELNAALAIVRTIRCPELEWQILWRLAERAGRTLRPGAETELAFHAAAILQGMSADLQPEDAPSFWHQGARALFLAYAFQRFGPEFRETLHLKPVTGWSPADDPRWDPMLLPEFVRASIRSRLR